MRSTGELHLEYYVYCIKLHSHPTPRGATSFVVLVFYEGSSHNVSLLRRQTSLSSKGNLLACSKYNGYWLYYIKLYNE